MDSWWRVTRGDSLAQGDLLPNCLIPDLPDNDGESESVAFDLGESDLILLTQSCDLAHSKTTFVALCGVYSISVLQSVHPHYKQKKNLEDIRRGYIPSLHLLQNPANPTDHMSALVVDLRLLYSLPSAYIRRHAAKLGDRFRLLSPYTEHLAQAYARFFMRVGLPADLPSYK